MAYAEMTEHVTEQAAASTDFSRSATEHATNRNATEQRAEVEEVIWQVKFKKWQDLPQEASAVVEAAWQEGRTNSGIYQQQRSKTRWDDYFIDFRILQQTNMVSGTKRDARRHIRTIEWRPTEVTTELTGVWREPIEDSMQHQQTKRNKIRRTQHEEYDNVPNLD